MELSSRPQAAAAAALIAAGMLAAAPVTAGLSAPTGLRDVALTSGAGSALNGLLGELLEQQSKLNSGLVEKILDFNGWPEITHRGDIDPETGHPTTIVDENATGLNGLQTDFINEAKEALGGLGLKNLQGDDLSTYAFGHSLNQLFDANNGFLTTGQGALLGLLGVHGEGTDTMTFPEQLVGSGMLNPGGSLDALSSYGGLEGIVGHYFGSAAFLWATITGENPEHSSVGDDFTGATNQVGEFNTGLIDFEKAFDTHLVAFEKGLLDGVFGPDSGLSEVFGRGFNSLNMLLDAQQQSLNAIIGATGYDPDELTQGLLTGGAGEGALNDGSIGGLQGVFDQGLAGLAALFNLDGGDFQNLFADFDPSEVGGAFTGFFDGLGDVFAPLGDLFTP